MWFVALGYVYLFYRAVLLGFRLFYPKGKAWILTIMVMGNILLWLFFTLWQLLVYYLFEPRSFWDGIEISQRLIDGYWAWTDGGNLWRVYLCLPYVTAVQSLQWWCQLTFHHLTIEGVVVNLTWLWMAQVWTRLMISITKPFKATHGTGASEIDWALRQL